MAGPMTTSFYFDSFALKLQQTFNFTTTNPTFA